MKYDYTVIENYNKVKFEKEVARVLNMGYKTAGGVMIAMGFGQPKIYFQALVKEYETEIDVPFPVKE